MSKIVFLDIGGVLNNNYFRHNYQGECCNEVLIDEDKVVLLGKIINISGAELVLHSGWRFWFDKYFYPINLEAKILIEIFEKYKLRISGITPDFSTVEIKETKKFSLVKAKEIKAWLEEHPEVEKWIVIDDLDLNDEDIKRKQIQTNQEVGLSIEDVEQALMMLE